VRHQEDLVWFVVKALDGRVFVCGRSKGMGEGVEATLVDVVMDKGTLNREDARTFWDGKKQAGQYVAVSLVVGSMLMEVLLPTASVGDLVMSTHHSRTTAQKALYSI